MPNALLTSQVITRESLRVLHSKLNFLGNINRQYDQSFAQAGAKIGDTLRIRMPNEYVVRNGITMSAQDTNESSVSLQVANVKGVDLNFTSQELALSLDDFSKRIIEPAMSTLAASIEADALSMVLETPVVNNIGSAITLKRVLEARKALQDNLVPAGKLIGLLNTQDNVDLVDIIGRTAGFDFYESTLLSSQATGTAAAVTTYTVNGAMATGATQIPVTGGTTTFRKGDVVTIANVFDVHPETKAVWSGVLKQFTVATDYAGGAGNLQIIGSIEGPTSAGRQNVSALPAAGAAISKIGGANAVYNPSVVFHPDAFTFATADLPMPNGVDFKAREVMDGISMSLVRGFNISDRSFPCRIDVLYGFKSLRPRHAVRVLSN
jgi:hypothetical protein